jgi:GxxExxY protein
VKKWAEDKETIMTENEVSGIIVDAAIKVHTVLGPGLLESAYEKALKHELKRRGLRVEQQVPITIHYEDLVIEEAFFADLIVEDLVIIELKSVEEIARIHKKQLLTYLKLTGKRVGLLINFNELLLKNGLTRIVHQLPE